MKFSVTKTGKNSALPLPVQPDIVLIYAEDVKQMPDVDDRKIVATSPVELHALKSPYTLYLSSVGQSAISNTEGETETRGWVHSISGTFPGTGQEIAEWISANINKGFIAFRRYCSGSYKIFGSKYNPLFFTGNIVEDEERSVCEIQFQQNRKSKVPYLLYEVEELNPVEPGKDRIFVLSSGQQPILFNDDTPIQIEKI